jgi:hypothetical protein
MGGVLLHMFELFGSDDGDTLRRSPVEDIVFGVDAAQRRF